MPDFFKIGKKKNSKVKTFCFFDCNFLFFYWETNPIITSDLQCVRSVLVTNNSSSKQLWIIHFEDHGFHDNTRDLSKSKFFAFFVVRDIIFLNYWFLTKIIIKNKKGHFQLNCQMQENKISPNLKKKINIFFI